MVSVLSKIEDVCKGLLEVVSAVKEKQVVDVSEFALFLAESNRLRSLLEEVVNGEDEEEEARW